jgi:hypothetical protein
VKEQPMTKAEMRAVSCGRSQEVHSCQDTRRCKHRVSRWMVIAFNLMLLSICVILFLYLIEGVDVPIWKRYENGSQSGFVRNKCKCVRSMPLIRSNAAQYGSLSLSLGSSPVFWQQSFSLPVAVENPLTILCVAHVIYVLAVVDSVRHFATCGKFTTDLGINYRAACLECISCGLCAELANQA